VEGRGVWVLDESGVYLLSFYCTFSLIILYNIIKMRAGFVDLEGGLEAHPI